MGTGPAVKAESLGGVAAVLESECASCEIETTHLLSLPTLFSLSLSLVTSPLHSRHYQFLPHHHHHPHPTLKLKATTRDDIVVVRSSGGNFNFNYSFLSVAKFLCLASSLVSLAANLAVRALELKEGGASGIGWEQGLCVVGDCVVGRWSRDWVVDLEAVVAAVV
ncbi:hypothetical protein SO802_022930 [Lithocarpus litseifolius]|uniref:Uncharacterized protein n=1 Tax=Lithocarpus litseifolius TaxID=425828 RepID=A0AAW2C767_9ROSI